MSSLKKLECAIFKSLFSAGSVFQLTYTYTNIKENLEYLAIFTYHLFKAGTMSYLFIYSTEPCT